MGVDAEQPHQQRNQRQGGQGFDPAGVDAQFGVLMAGDVDHTQQSRHQGKQGGYGDQHPGRQLTGQRLQNQDRADRGRCDQGSALYRQWHAAGSHRSQNGQQDGQRHAPPGEACRHQPIHRCCG